jgi:gliding motility-associated-like protein
MLLGLLSYTNAAAQTVNFSISVPSKEGCSPLSVNFTDISTGGTAATRTWDLGNGVVIPNGLATVGANYLTAQIYTVTLTVTFTNGVTLSKSDYVTVHPKPVANFTSVDLIGCATHTANFTSTSTTATGSITNWQWDFGAGGLSGAFPNPSFPYTNPGNYQVSLIVKNNWGCTSDALTRPQYIKVFSKPTASFTATPYFSCNNSFTANFTNTTTGGDPANNTYEWDFGDGSPAEFTKDVTHLYSGVGNYIAKLTVRLGNNCVSTSTQTIYVGKPTPAFGTFPNEVCVNTPTTFTGTGTANTYYLKWIFSDNGQQHFYSPISHTFTTPGTFEVQLIAYTYPGCNDTVKRNIIVKPGPVIDFTPDIPSSACKPHTVTFTNNTVGNDLKFAWNYGDGSPVDTINGQGPAVHTYPNFGTFSVTVYAKDTSVGGGCFAYKTFNYVRIYQPSVTLNVLPPNGCKPLPVNFTATVNNPSGVPVTSYIWNFGEGLPVTTTVPNTFHLYNNAGTFPATVTIVMPGGCSYVSPIKTVNVITLCDDDGGGGGGGGGGFIIGKTCADKYTITFTDTVSNNTVVSWDFGDGSPILNTGVLNPVSHTYTPPQKVYVVTVTRQHNTTGVITSSQKRIIIIDEKADFIPNLFDICKDKNVLFKTIGIDSSLIKKYTWDFGDGTPRQVINNAAYYATYGIYLNGNTNHTYTTNGTYFVKLIIEDKLGCKDSLAYPVPIKVAGPVALFKIDPLTSCASPLLTTISDTSKQNGSTPITEWQWNFGDATPLQTNTDSLPFTHSYTGNNYVNFYTVTLKIKDAIGCEATLSKPSYVKIYKPKADFFSYNTLQCKNYSIFLYNYSNAYNATYKWYYGDGTSSVGFYGSHTYANDGEYDIKLVVTDENGCKDSTTKTSYIKLVKPKANFKINDTLQCAPASITFADSSKYATSYIWDFGDGGTGSTSPTPAPHIYGTPGFYNVKLKIAGVSGCIDSITKTIRVRGPIGNLTVGGNQGCRPYNLPLKVTGSFIDTYAWDYGDGTPVNANTKDSAVNHAYNYAGKYLPNIVLTSPEGCPYTLKVTDTVFVDSLKTKFTIDQNVFCQVGASNTVTFTNQSVVPSFSNITYNYWSWGDGNSEVNTNGTVTHTYNGYGTFNVYLATKSKYGCVDTMKIFPAITINAKPQPAIAGNTVYCLSPNSKLQFTGSVISPDPIAKHKWMIDADSVANTSNLNIDYRVPGTHTLKYTVTTDKDCTDFITKIFTVDSVVSNFNASPVQFCGPKLVTFTNQSSSASPLQNFIWTYDDGAIETANLNPQHLYNNTRAYTAKLFLQTQNGCKDSLEKIIVIDSVPKAVITGDNLKCKPDNYLYTSNNVITLDNISNYQWKVDGNIVTGNANLNYSFTAGSHTINLKVQTTKGCEDEIAKTIIIDSVKAAYTVLPPKICGDNGTVQFTNTGGGKFAITNYYWNFDDGQTELVLPSPSHTYNQPGEYNVFFKLTSVNGCADSLLINKAVSIYRKPAPVINGDDLQCKTGIKTYTASDLNNTAVSIYKWKVNGADVTTATGSQLNYNFSPAGTYTIKLELSNVNDCNDAVERIIKVDSLYTNFAVDKPQICGNNGTVKFTNNAFAAFGITNYYWDFGDNTSSTDPNPVHNYNTTGEFTVKLLIISANGCKDSITLQKAVNIYSKPIVNISGNNLHCSPGTFTYNSNINTVNTIGTYKWELNNSVIASTASINYAFTAGTQNLTFIAVTDKGCSDTSYKQIKIDSLVAAFNIPVSNKCGVPAVINFNELSFAQFGILNYTWNFGNGNTANNNLPNPTSTYNASGTFPVNLKITSTTGCDKTSAQNSSVVIYDKPTVGINSITTACANTTINFDGTIISQDEVISKEWKVNNVSAGTGNDLSYLFLTANTYNITFTVKTKYGCDETKNTVVTINPLPVPNAAPNATICLGSTVQLNAATGTTYSWSPAATLINASSSSPVAKPAATTKYYVLVTNNFDCKKTDSVLITVDKPVNLNPSPDVVICENGRTQLNATGNAARYSWAPATGLNNPAIPNPVATPAITTRYQVIGYSSNVCKNDTGYVVVKIDPTPTVNAGPDITVSAGTTVQLNALGSSTVTSYTWAPSLNLTCTSCPNPAFVADKTTEFIVTASTQYGCLSSDNITVIVLCNKGAVYIANAFTPNGDGKNDRFGISGYGIAKVKRFTVFNRYGQVVFERKDFTPVINDITNSWDGRVKGQEVTTTTSFVYVAEVQCNEGNTFVLKNSVIVIR